VTTIRTTCPDCGDVDLRADDVKIMPERESYVFVCTGPCQRLVSKPANLKIINLLESAGVKIIEDAKVSHPEPPPKHLTPFGLDDIIDFHQNFDDELKGLLDV